MVAYHLSLVCHANLFVLAVQLYLESVHDLLAPEKTNIPIVEDAKTGEVSLPGAAIVEVRDLEHVFQLLQIGEANRHAANTKMNTESSRSHAILIVCSCTTTISSVITPILGSVSNDMDMHY